MLNNLRGIQITKDKDYWGRLAQAAVKDEAAFSELYDYFFPRVYQYILGKTKDEALSDELVSDTFIRMYRHLSQYEPERGAFSTWLFRIAQNVISKYYGRKEHAVLAPWDDSFDFAAPEHETPEKQALTKERSEELRIAMGKLKERDRKILEMTYWLNMKSNEIGEVLGMAPSSVRAALKQAKERLRSLLEEG